jgi:hypothetical protein
MLTGEFFRIKINGMELSTGKILEENLVQSALQQTRGREFTIQQDNNQGQIYTGVRVF